MDQNITKMLFIGAGLLLTILVIVAGVNLVGIGQDMTESASEDTARIAAELNRAQFSAYDATTVSGTAVVSAISQYRDLAGDLIIDVTTNATSNTYYLSTTSGSVDDSDYTVSGTLTAKTSLTSDLNNAKDSTSSTYINPSGQFSANIAYDENDVIRAIIFEQE